jgi:hypothetical protein
MPSRNSSRVTNSTTRTTSKHLSNQLGTVQALGVAFADAETSRCPLVFALARATPPGLRKPRLRTGFVGACLIIKRLCYFAPAGTHYVFADDQVLARGACSRGLEALSDQIEDIIAYAVTVNVIESVPVVARGA